MASADILPPPSKVKLDRLDWKILFELEKDSFQSFSKIGKKLKIGRDVVHYRVKRLEESGVIKKYITTIDYSKLGFVAGAIYIKLGYDFPKLKKEILEYYKKNEDVWWIFEMEGYFDIAFGFYAKSISELRNSYRNLIGKYAKNINKVKFRLFNEFHHFKRNYLYPNKNYSESSFSINSNAKKITDKTDDRILKLISENARMDYVLIAKKLKITPAQVHYKLKKLKENKIILGSRPLIDLEKIGYKLYKLDLYLDDYSSYNSILKFSKSNSNIIYAYDVFGGADLELDIEAKNYEEFNSIENSIKEKFHNVIKKTDFIMFLKEHKLKYFPNI